MHGKPEVGNCLYRHLIVFFCNLFSFFFFFFSWKEPLFSCRLILLYRLLIRNHTYQISSFNHSCLNGVELGGWSWRRWKRERSALYSLSAPLFYKMNDLHFINPSILLSGIFNATYNTPSAITEILNASIKKCKKKKDGGVGGHKAVNSKEDGREIKIRHIHYLCACNLWAN